MRRRPNRKAMEAEIDHLWFLLSGATNLLAAIRPGSPATKEEVKAAVDEWNKRSTSPFPEIVWKR